MERILRHLLTAPLDAAEVRDVASWWRRHGEGATGFATPIDRAMAAALTMDRVGWAFASGYQEALRRLVPGLPDGAKAALCATEEGGNHPRAIEARLSAADGGFTLSGDKKFTTLGPQADLLLVVASEGEDAGGRKRLALVQVPAGRDGVRVETMSELPFVPEVPHGVTHFADVRLAKDERLPGDGYGDYLKPFRTIEDVHVHAAVLAWMLGVGRRFGWPEPLLARLVACLAAARALAAASPVDEAVHVAVAGLLAQGAAVIEQAEPHWKSADAAVASRWSRDRALLGVAAKARHKRVENAWRRLSEPYPE
ncbi:MAG: acyl-CoA dehydrogenase family protein [Myxococcota bacterium]